MRPTSVQKKLSHEYSSPPHGALSNRSHSFRPISPRNSLLFTKNHSPSKVLSGESAEYPPSLSRGRVVDLDKSALSLPFENEDLKNLRALREIERERAIYESQKQQDDMDENDSDDDEEEENDDMSEGGSISSAYSDMDDDQEERGKKGFNANNPMKKHSSICQMSDDDDEDTSSEEDEEDREARIRQCNKEQEENEIAEDEKQVELIRMGLFGNNKDDNEEDTSDEDSDDDIRVECQTFERESIPQPKDEEVLYSSLRSEVLSENELIKLKTNIKDIKKNHQDILKNKAEKLKFEVESKKYLDEVNAITKLIKDTKTQDKNTMLKLTIASRQLEIARSNVIMFHETLLVLNRQLGEYVINMIDDFMDSVSDWHSDINACAYYCRHWLGPDIWNIYGESIIATIKKRMIRHYIQQFYDQVDVKQITPHSCNGFLTYKVGGYNEIKVEQQDYVSKLMLKYHIEKKDSADQELLKIRIKQFVGKTNDVEECYGRGFRIWLSKNEALLGTHQRLVEQYENLQFDFCREYLWNEIGRKYYTAERELFDGV